MELHLKTVLVRIQLLNQNVLFTLQVHSSLGRKCSHYVVLFSTITPRALGVKVGVFGGCLQCRIYVGKLTIRCQLLIYGMWLLQMFCLGPIVGFLPFVTAPCQTSLLTFAQGMKLFFVLLAFSSPTTLPSFKKTTYNC